MWLGFKRFEYESQKSLTHIEDLLGFGPITVCSEVIQFPFPTFQNGDTALHIAAALDKKSIVKKLLQWGADPAVRNHVRFERSNGHMVSICCQLFC